jgi:uncharacterized paraquat-inducible protein A
MSEENYFVTCHCQQCNGNIEFDASLFQAGTMTTCPHCGIETPLFIPKVSKSAEKQTEKVPEKTAKIVKQTRYSGGMEDTLEDVGGIFLFLGILGGIGAIVGAIVAFNDSETGVGVDLLCVGAALIFASAVNRILFRAGAEIVRLLKKLNDLKFSGQITEPDAINEYTCSSCDSFVFSKNSAKCQNCGAKFEK